MPARRGHEVSLIVTAHRVPQVLGIANWSTIDGVNYARTDAPSLIRAWDFVVLPCVFLAMAWNVDRAIDVEAWRTSHQARTLQ